MDKAILFDFDWTLVVLGVNWSRLTKRLNSFFKKYGVHFEGGGVIRPSYELARELGKRGYDVDGILDIVDGIIREEEVIGAKRVKIIRGSKRLIEKLKKEFYLGIVTNNSMDAVVIALKEIGIDKKDFKAIAARKAHSELKPSPEPVLAAIKGLPKTVKVVYMVGDEPADMIAAVAAGKMLKGKKKVMTIGFPGWMGKHALTAAKPDYVVDSLSEIARVLGL